MFKVLRVPGWVWACLVVAVFVFGTLYVMPEARQALGALFKRDTQNQAAADKAFCIDLHPHLSEVFAEKERQGKRCAIAVVQFANGKDCTVMCQ